MEHTSRRQCGLGRRPSCQALHVQSLLSVMSVKLCNSIISFRDKNKSKIGFHCQIAFLGHLLPLPTPLDSDCHQPLFLVLISACLDANVWTSQPEGKSHILCCEFLCLQQTCNLLIELLILFKYQVFLSANRNTLSTINAYFFTFQLTHKPTLSN